jgi:hypothetical protein
MARRSEKTTYGKLGEQQKTIHKVVASEKPAPPLKTAAKFDFGLLEFS